MHRNSARKWMALLLSAAVTLPAAACAKLPDEQSQPAEPESQASYTVDISRLESAVSPTLFGIFLEDINFAVDGGLYAEMVKNRSFEYGPDAKNGKLHGWSAVGDGEFTVMDGSADGSCLNENNPSYARLTQTAASSAEFGIRNTGFLDGMNIEEGAAYEFSLYIRGETSHVRVALEDIQGSICAEAVLTGVTDQWQKLSAQLVPNAPGAIRLGVYIGGGRADVDMISMMPKDTFAGLPVREDLGQALKELSPAFLRFPGGCAVEGRDLESMYSWKDSIGNGLTYTVGELTLTGDVSARPQGKDIWSGNAANPYYTTYGLGFYEYFCLCEALDCLAVPVLNAGMTCPIQSQKYRVFALNSPEFQQCVQDALDLAEFCRGGADTRWGSVRIAMGHVEPFELQYIAVGNEQWQTEYYHHYLKFVEAFQQAAEQQPEIFGGIELCVANGPSSGSTQGWDYVENFTGEEDLITTLVDEHYYEEPAWFLQNNSRYDSYDRSLQAKVFLGEYAARSNQLKAALAEASFMTGLERNGDVVQMACYAPLFGNGTLNQWTPDMIFFRKDSVLKTVNYYVQQMFAQNAIRQNVAGEMVYAETGQQAVLSGGIGLGSWMTSVSYSDLKVVQNDGGKVLYESKLDSWADLKADGWLDHEGEWDVENGALVQLNKGAPADESTGDAMFLPGDGWTDYTMTVRAKILSGAEGFLIPVCFRDTGNLIFWNLGGWGNTVSCLQTVEGGSKSGQVTGTVRNVTLKQGQEYRLRLVVSGNNLKCYLDDILYADYTVPTTRTLFQSAGLAENGDLVLKLVNAGGSEIPMDISLTGWDSGKYASEAVTAVLSGTDPNQANTNGAPDALIPVNGSAAIADGSLRYTVPAYSVNVIRIPSNQ